MFWTFYSKHFYFMLALVAVMLCTATRASRSATGAEINGTGPDGCLPELDMFPCCKSCVYGICAFVLRCFFFFFCSQTVLQMEHSLGVKKIFFFPPLSPHVKAVFFLIPCLLFCLPRCHMYVVYVWTGWWLISLVLVLVTIKGYYYYYYINKNISVLYRLLPR